MKVKNSLLEQKTTVVKKVFTSVAHHRILSHTIRLSDWGNIFIDSMADPTSDSNSEGEYIS